MAVPRVVLQLGTSIRHRAIPAQSSYHRRHAGNPTRDLRRLQLPLSRASNHIAAGGRRNPRNCPLRL